MCDSIDFSEGSESSTHYLSDTNRFDVSSKGPSSGISVGILLTFPTLPAFAVSRSDIYSLTKRYVFSRNLICVNSFRAKYFAFWQEKAVMESLSFYRQYH